MKRSSKNDTLAKWHVLPVVLCLVGQVSADDPIHHAAYHSKISALKAELDKGVDINLPNSEDGRTPLMFAITSAAYWASHNRRFKNQRTEIETVKFLIEAGADLERKDKYDMTVLMLACFSADVSQETVTALLDAGADVHAKYTSGSTALEFAVLQDGDVERLKLLLEAGAGTDINVAGSQGRTVVMTAAASGDVARLILVISAGADIHATDKSGLTALSHASMRGNTRRMEVLIRGGAEVNTSDHRGRTPLMYAARDGQPGNMMVLLRAGADIQQMDELGLIALAYAAMSPDKPLNRVQTLMDNGADLHMRTQGRAPQFHYLLAFGDRSTIHFALDKGVDINSIEGGRTPLMMAAVSTRVENVAALLDKGADANVTTEKGETALSLVEKRYNTSRFSRREELFSMLRKHTKQKP